MLHEELVSRIEILIDRKKFPEAQQRIMEGLLEYPDSGELHALQSKIFLEYKDTEKAMTAIHRAIAAEPTEDYFFYLKSMIHLEKDEYQEAKESIDTAIEFYPYHAGYYGVKSAILLDLGHKPLAIETAQKGLEIDPNNTFCQNILSMAYTRSGQTADSRVILENQLENDPENSLTHANMGYQYLRESNIPKAKEHFGAALALDPNSEFAKSGMLQAIKASNILYRKLLEYSFFMEKHSKQYQWMFIIGLLILVNVMPFLLPIYLILVLWTWFSGPLSDIIVYFDKYSRYLFNDLERIATQINIGLLSGSILSLGLALAMDINFAGLAFALFVAMVPVYLYESKISPAGKWAMIGFAAAFIGLGVLGAIMILGGLEPTLAWGALIFLVVAFTWIGGNVS